jgi:hypothetical protein
MFIIDGNNLLHSIYKAEESSSFSDIGLCRNLSAFLKIKGQSGEIIFDGAGPRDKSPYDNIENLEVSFAGIGHDTDTVIEEKIKVSSSPKRLIIVSSDRRLRKAARTRKATSIKSEDFWINVTKQLSKKSPVKEPREKLSGLSESETQQWLDIFGIE